MKRIHYYSGLLIIGANILLNGCSSSDKAKPAITSVEPSAGEEGDAVVIKGNFLATTKSITFGTTTALVIDAQTEQVTTQVPAGATEGNSSITVTNEGGSSKADFVVLPPSPVLPSDEKASITSVVPANSYKGYPIMIRGKNLIGTNKVLFNSTEATIITKYNGTVTVFVPDVPNGKYSIKLVTSENGNSNGQDITITSPPSGFPAPPSANFIAPPPANFSATISNQWSIFLLSQSGNEDCPLVDLNDDNFCGSYAFTKDPTTHVVTDNYIEFTRDGVEHFYGQWSSQYAIPCTQRIVFISGKDGHILEATVDVSFTDGCQ